VRFQVWDLNSSTSVAVLEGHKHSVYCLSWLQEEGILFSGSKDKSIRVWSLQNGSCLRVINKKQDLHKRGVISMDLLPHLNYLATGGLDKSLKLWDAETGECIKTEKKAHRGWVSCVRAGPHYLLCTGGDTKIKLWDTRTPDSVLTIRTVQAHPYGDYVSTLQFDQNKIISGNLKGKVIVHDMCTSRRINKLKAHTRRVSSLQYDETQLVTASSDKKLKIWHFDEPKKDDQSDPRKCLLS